MAKLLGGSQTCNSPPLASGIVPPENVEKVLGNIIRSIEIEWDRHLNVGILGAKYVPEVLAENGGIELAYETIT